MRQVDFTKINIKQEALEWLKASKFPAIALSIYFMFHSLFLGLLKKIWIEPIASKLEKWLFTEIVFVGLFLVFIGFMFIMIRRRYFFSKSFILWTLTIFIIYNYYRHWNPLIYTFHKFSQIKQLNGVRFFDLMGFALFIILLFSIWTSIIGSLKFGKRLIIESYKYCKKYTFTKYISIPIDQIKSNIHRLISSIESNIHRLISSIKHIKYVRHLRVFVNRCIFSASYIAFIKKSMFAHKSNTNGGFIPDSPIDNPKDDKLGRREFAETLAKTIHKTKTPKGSFAVGITSEWGGGKTSFLTLIDDALKEQSNGIHIHFNPWLNHKSEVITKDFFKLLGEELSKYSSNIGTYIKDYSEILSGVGNSDLNKILSPLLVYLKQKTDLKSEFDKIQLAIQKINRPIYIYIDDLDRLQADEILCVLKLIRNSANFGKTFFFVAYDKEYLVRALLKNRQTKPDDYLEKIFQTEIQLPFYKKKLLLEHLLECVSLFKNLNTNNPISVCLDNIKNSISERRSFSDILTDRTVSKTSFERILSSNLSNIRHVSRFVNQLTYSYDYLGHNTLLEDLIKLEFLRFIDSELYEDLYYNRFKVLETNDNKHYCLVEPLRKEKNDVENNYLIKIKNNQSLHGLLEILFPENGENDSIRINQCDCVDRYFLAKEDSSWLSSKNFYTSYRTCLENYSLSEFLKQIDFWVKDEGYPLESIINFLKSSRDKFSCEVLWLIANQGNNIETCIKGDPNEYDIIKFILKTNSLETFGKSLLQDSKYKYLNSSFLFTVLYNDQCDKYINYHFTTTTLLDLLKEDISMVNHIVLDSLLSEEIPKDYIKEIFTYMFSNIDNYKDDNTITSTMKQMVHSNDVKSYLWLVTNTMRDYDFNVHLNLLYYYLTYLKFEGQSNKIGEIIKNELQEHQDDKDAIRLLMMSSIILNEQDDLNIAEYIENEGEMLKNNPFYSYHIALWYSKNAENTKDRKTAKAWFISSLKKLARNKYLYNEAILAYSLFFYKYKHEIYNEPDENEAINNALRFDLDNNVPVPNSIIGEIDCAYLSRNKYNFFINEAISLVEDFNTKETETYEKGNNFRLEPYSIVDDINTFEKKYREYYSI